MRAAVVERYGPPEVVRIVDLPCPKPGSGEVLVKVSAAAVSSADARIRAARFPRGFGVVARLIFGIRGPRRGVLGSAYSGVIAEVGRDVGGLAVGDAVCGMPGMRLGAHAEYVAVRADTVSLRPRTVTDEDAAGLLFGGDTALHYLRDRARIRRGESLLVNGAAGAIGTNAVQLARYWGVEVTAVTSAANAALVRELGARHVIDYRQEPVERIDKRFDVVLDAVGNLSIPAGRRLLNPGGRLLLAVANLAQMLQSRGNVVAGPAPETPANADYLLGLLVDRALRVVHDSQFSLDDIAEAHRRVDTGRKVGNVIVRVS